MKFRFLPSLLVTLTIWVLSSTIAVMAQDTVAYSLNPNTLPIGSSPVYGVYLTASDNSSLKTVKVAVPAGMGVTIVEPTLLLDNDTRMLINIRIDAAVQPGDILFHVSKGITTKSTVLKLVKRMPLPLDATEGGAFAYVTLVDPENVHDIFGRRISQRYIALQVTVENLSSQHDYLIHDVSLDLNEVFLDPSGKSVAATNDSNKNQDNKGAARPDVKQRQKGPPLQTQTVAVEKSLARPYRYRLSSLELALMRGVAERGQGQDRRNLSLRALRGLGSLAAAFLGVTTLGSSYAPAVAMFNGPLLTSYGDVFPDYTINQNNRLNDSAYRANTLVPKGQSKALVVFIPQATFLTNEQRKVFRSDPVLLAFPANGSIDFRRAAAVVHGTLIEEINNQPPAITTVLFDSSTVGSFQNERPLVKGRVIGKYLANADIKLAQAIPGVSVIKDSSTDTELKFQLSADQPIRPNAVFPIEVSNSRGAATYSAFASFTPAAPVITSISPEEVEQPSETKSHEITIAGENFMNDMQKSDITFDDSKGLSVEGVNFVGPKSIKVQLKIEKDAPSGVRNIRVRTPMGGPSAQTKSFTIKKKPS